MTLQQRKEIEERKKELEEILKESYINNIYVRNHQTTSPQTFAPDDSPMSYIPYNNKKHEPFDHYIEDEKFQ